MDFVWTILWSKNEPLINAYTPCHVTMGLFEVIDKFKVAMVTQVKEILLSYNLLDKLITYMKDKGGNMSTLARALSFVVNCAPLKLAALWQGSCFGHIFSKTCQYACNDATICFGFWEVSLKSTLLTLQKKISWIKKSNKGQSEWKRACLDVGFCYQKLKTSIKTKLANKVILFQKTLEYKDAINLCYGKQETLELQRCVLDA